MRSNAPKSDSVWDLAVNKDLDNAIKQFRSLPAHARTGPDTLGYCLAVVYRRDWLTPGRMRELQEIIPLLESLGNRFTDPSMCYYLRALAHYDLGDYHEAAVWFKKASIEDIRPTCKEMLANCSILLDRPKEKQSFRSRVQKAWAAFTSEEADLRKAMNAAAGHPKLEHKVTNRGTRLLDIAFRDSYWSWDEGDRPTLQLDPSQLMCLALQQQYFVDHAPKEISERWNLCVGIEAPTDQELRDMSGEDDQLSDLAVQIRPLPTGLSELVVSHPSLDPKTMSSEERETLTERVLACLGELMYTSTFVRLDCRDTPLEGPTMQLEELLPVLEVLGCGRRDDIPSLLRRRHCFNTVPVTHTSKTDYRWRDDVFRYNTVDPLLSIQFIDEEAGALAPEYLAGSGAIPCFVVFPLKGQTENPPALMRDLLKELDAAMDPEIAAVLGNAEGLQFGYLDLLAWDLQPALDTAAELLRRHNLPWACWHSFFTVDRTVQLF